MVSVWDAVELPMRVGPKRDDRGREMCCVVSASRNFINIDRAFTWSILPSWICRAASPNLYCRLTHMHANSLDYFTLTWLSKWDWYEMMTSHLALKFRRICFALSTTLSCKFHGECEQHFWGTAASSISYHHTIFQPLILSSLDHSFILFLPSISCVLVRGILRAPQNGMISQIHHSVLRFNFHSFNLYYWSYFFIFVLLRKKMSRESSSQGDFIDYFHGNREIIQYTPLLIHLKRVSPKMAKFSCWVKNYLVNGRTYWWDSPFDHLKE